MQQINLGKKTIASERPAFVMGIVNVTDDSFYEKSRGGIEKAFEQIEQGADILDLGAESTRPGFTEVPAEEQIKRLVPVIQAVRKESQIPLSIDTRSAKVFLACCEAGADILNDVSSLESDVDLFNIVKDYEASVILMHGFGQSEEHQTDKEIPCKVVNYLKQRTEICLSRGISQKKILWDAGIGFGKTMEENVLLLKNTDNLIIDNIPLVMAVSRKRVIGFLTGRDVEERLTGTVAVNAFAVRKGAKILRVHDVKPTIDMLNVMKNLEL